MSLPFTVCLLLDGGNELDFFTGIWDAIDKALIRENRYEFYLSGIGNTLLISLFAVMLGFLIGAFVAVIKQLCSKKRGLGWIAKICDFYVFVIISYRHFFFLLKLAKEHPSQFSHFYLRVNRCFPLYLC